MSFPLENARLCMDCDTVFDGPLCPSCTSESFFPLSRWIRPALEEISPKPPRSLGETLGPKAGKTARNASLLLAGSGLAYGLWKAFYGTGKPSDSTPRKKKPEDKSP
ncbi:MAG: hypothetical protein EXQ56_04275 [Acidobacteria bacterium]|nr:hypothetical protein [Acidobacteriota bacterium]